MPTASEGSLPAHRTTATTQHRVATRYLARAGHPTFNVALNSRSDYPLHLLVPHDLKGLWDSNGSQMREHQLLEVLPAPGPNSDERTVDPFPNINEVDLVTLGEIPLSLVFCRFVYPRQMDEENVVGDIPRDNLFPSMPIGLAPNVKEEVIDEMAAI